MLNCESSDISNIVFSIDEESILITYDRNRVVQLYNIYKDKRHIISDNTRYPCVSAEYHPNGSVLMLSYFNSIVIYDAYTYKKIQTLTLRNSAVLSISFSPDGKYFITANTDNNIYIWDAEKFFVLNTMHSHIENLMYAKYTSDGLKVISYYSNATAIVWDIDKLKMLLRLSDIQFDHCLTPTKSNFIIAKKSRSLLIYNLIEIDDILKKKNINKNIKRLEQFLQVKLDGVTLKDATIPPLSPKESYPKHHPFHWIEDAENGDAEAMYQLGLIYDRDNENDKALEWYKKALKAGYKPAEERIAFLEKWMAEHPEKTNNS